MDSEEFYSQESARYSQKRYAGPVDSYIQYFFRRRLSIVLEWLRGQVLSLLTDEEGHSPESTLPASLLEVGCADGIILREIATKIPGKFSRLVGVDTVPAMVNRARELTHDLRIRFFEKSQTPDEKFDLILLIGFMTPVLWHSELDYIKSHLSANGYIIISLGGARSLHARFKLRGAPYLEDYRSYSSYRKMFGPDFEIVAQVPYGFFVPKLWVFPALACLIQPILDLLLAPLVPDLFHEFLYLLRPKI